MVRIIKRNLVGCIFGMKGSGKSFLTKEIVQEYPRVIAIDNIGEYPLEVSQGFEASVKRIVQASRQSTFRIAVRTESVEKDLEIIKLVGTMQSLLLVVEETSKYVNAVWMPEPIENLIRYGRHRDISQIYLARRPSEIARDLTANADFIATFRAQEPRDIAYLRSFMGERAYDVPRLGEYEMAVHISGDAGKLPLSILERIVPD